MGWTTEERDSIFGGLYNFTRCRNCLVPTIPAIKGVGVREAFTWWVKHPRHEADHSVSFSVEVRWSGAIPPLSTPSWRHGYQRNTVTDLLSLSYFSYSSFSSSTLPPYSSSFKLQRRLNFPVRKSSQVTCKHITDWHYDPSWTSVSWKNSSVLSYYSALNGGAWLALRPSRFIPRETCYLVILLQELNKHIAYVLAWLTE
jgi:hypothetical protein